MSEQTFKGSDLEKLNKEEIVQEVVVRESISAWKDAWLRLKENKLAMLSLILLFIIVFFAAFGQMMTPYDFQANDLQKTNLAPSAEHWFGTDALGRDMWERTWMGTGISLQVGLYAA